MTDERDPMDVLLRRAGAEYRAAADDLLQREQLARREIAVRSARRAVADSGGPLRQLAVRLRRVQLLLSSDWKEGGRVIAAGALVLVVVVTRGGAGPTPRVAPDPPVGEPPEVQSVALAVSDADSEWREGLVQAFIDGPEEDLSMAFNLDALHGAAEDEAGHADETTELESDMYDELDLSAEEYEDEKEVY